MTARSAWMVGLFLSIACLCSSSFAAAPATGPATAPSTSPAGAALVISLEQVADKIAVRAALETPATSPTTSPATTQPHATAGAGNKLPTPAELFAQIKRAAEEKAALTQIAHFDLNEPITEKPADFSFTAPGKSLTLYTLLDRLEKARNDKQVKAVLITLGDVSLDLAQAQEVRDQLKAMARGGKKVFVYADSYDTVGYTIASAATDICLMPGGEIMIPGVGLETMFYKGALDKVGVQADYIQIGEYKGAEEPYTRSGPSDELRSELTRLTEALYDQLVDNLSTARGVSRDEVKQLIDDTMVSASAAEERGFVDHVIDQDGLRELITERVGNEINLLRDYGAPRQEEIDLSNPFALLASMAKKPEPTTRPSVAIIYAAGTIVDGDGEAGLFGGGGVGSEPMRRTFRAALRDDNIKAVVLRIDSPGGSALASEVMWQAARRLAAKKPVVVSIGSMAASGGYYLASAGDYIFADPMGIVGSIGVVGGKFVTKDLYGKLGLATERFAKGRNAALFSSSEPWSDRQKRLVRQWMQQTYDQFTQRVMTTRSGKIKDIDKVARGRIFLARDAKELGMVDELGGTQAAIAYAANKAGLAQGDFEVRAFPEPKTLADLLGFGSGGDEVRLPFQPITVLSINPDSILNALPPTVRQQVSQQVRMAQLLEQRPVILMSPFIVTSR